MAIVKASHVIALLSLTALGLVVFDFFEGDYSEIIKSDDLTSESQSYPKDSPSPVVVSKMLSQSDVEVLSEVSGKAPLSLVRGLAQRIPDAGEDDFDPSKPEFNQSRLKPQDLGEDVDVDDPMSAITGLVQSVGDDIDIDDFTSLVGAFPQQDIGEALDVEDAISVASGDVESIGEDLDPDT